MPPAPSPWRRPAPPAPAARRTGGPPLRLLLLILILIMIILRIMLRKMKWRGGREHLGRDEELSRQQPRARKRSSQFCCQDVFIAIDYDFMVMTCVLLYNQNYDVVVMICLFILYRCYFTFYVQRTGGPPVTHICVTHLQHIYNTYGIICVYVHMCVYIYIYIYIYIHMYVCVYIYICMCVYIYIYVLIVNLI